MVSAATKLQLTKELTKGLTDLAEVTITIPLSSVTKNIHTRMFIQTKLSLPELQNMKQEIRSYDQPLVEVRDSL